MGVVTVPPFKPIPPAVSEPARQNSSRPYRLAPGSSVGIGSVEAVPPFQALPPSISRVSQQQQQQQQLMGIQVVRAPVAFRNSLQMATNHFQVGIFI